MSSPLSKTRTQRAAEPDQVTRSKTTATLNSSKSVAAALEHKQVSSKYLYLLLSLLTVFCLAPFSGRAFHVDDTLFVWAAQHITKQPLNPYGFDLIWDFTRVQMSEVTQNPPLASYYAAVVGPISGWSERALHLWFILPALLVVLGTYRLALRFTDSPMLAALATLLTPGFIVSALSVMSDTLMVAIWVLAAVFWIEAEERQKVVYHLISASLIAACALTKYFGIALLPLLFVYSLVRRRRIGAWMLPLLLPILILAGYEFWTADLYGTGLLSRAAEFAHSQREVMNVPYIGNALVATCFTGGCIGLICVFTWSRKVLLASITLGALAAASILFGWVALGLQIGGSAALAYRQQHWMLMGAQLLLWITSGIAVLALAATDFWKHRDASSLLLTLWVFGTFIFAAFFNWTVNARSLLPMIPAAAILVTRRIGEQRLWINRHIPLMAVLAIAAAISLSVAVADSKLANASRQAAVSLCANAQQERATLWFEGHWGFQYYMQLCGARPMDFSDPQIRAGDLVAIPENNVELMQIPPNMTESATTMTFRVLPWASTIRPDIGAGFYSSAWGPLPFVFGPIPPERYQLIRTR